MSPLIIIVLAVLGLGVAAWLVLRPRPAALPAASPPRDALPAPDAGERAVAPDASTVDDRGAGASIEAPHDRDTDEPGPPNVDTLDSDGDGVEPGPASDASTADDGPNAAEAEAEVAAVDDGSAAAGGLRFAPPPRRAQAEPATREAVPLPVDKPKRDAEPDDAARREQERQRYRQGLAKTRGGFVAKLARIFKGKPKVDTDLRDRIEEVLFTADIGTSTAEKLQAKVTTVLDRKEIADPEAVWAVIRQATLELLELDAPPPDYAPEPGPYVLLMIGVNGVGKTTTLGKLAAQHRRAGRKVLLVAGDTFRAAAVEQLDVWARRVGCELHHGHDKADPSSVIFDGITRGRREGFDVVLCDTAGRLHTRKELMDELAKVGRAATKALAKGLSPERAATIEGAHDVYLVLDATIGQNALAQAKLFKDTIGFTGLVVTKLDGTAKGGVVLGICDELQVPIRYVGIGEGIDDLRAFDPEDFVDALLLDRDGETPSSSV